VENNTSIINMTVPTGDYEAGETQIQSCSFGNYIIQVRLGHEGEFIGIESVEINQDFRDYLSKIRSIDVIDVEKYYVEE
jgi:hypothetical protein